MSELPVLAAIIPEIATPTAISLDFAPDTTEVEYANVLTCLVDTHLFASGYLPVYLGDARN